MKYDKAALETVFRYDPETGEFFRKIATDPKVRAGEKVGFLRPSGYVMLPFKSGSLRAHRVAWLLMTGELPKFIDHIDGNPGNNKFSNLRSVTHAQNMKNMSGHKDRLTSQYKGVCRDKAKNKWLVQIMANGKKIQKRFNDEREAAEEYIFLAIEHHGEFARFE